MMGSVKVVWAFSGENDPKDGWVGEYATREEAIAEAREQFGLDAAIWVISGKIRPPTYYLPDADAILDLIIEISDSCVVGGVSDCFPDVTEEAKEDLEQMLEVWANKHLVVTFWVADGVAERVEPDC